MNSEVERLTRERDEWERLCDDGGKVEVHWQKRAEAAEARLQQMTKALEEGINLICALKPHKARLVLEAALSTQGSDNERQS